MESVTELFSYCDHGTSWILSSLVVGDCDDESKAQRKEDLCPCMNATSGVQRGIDLPTRETLLESFTSGYSLLDSTGSEQGSDDSEYRL